MGAVSAFQADGEKTGTRYTVDRAQPAFKHLVRYRIPFVAEQRRCRAV
eukprot:CAMPEP_0205915280 /NCGR_PEP_ID=MMETSP1325-20131115/7768_1 /ASSEMBLY_ACC=CAM_ASM_000708 /TAXON_ID=236786 /ORGANISM="Florenciella sp., Strain RCC1007" /LENGTH=47 /DNA_ID= /DNA_START= /DNA_END= /DNA_ORIENTATION=